MDRSIFQCNIIKSEGIYSASWPWRKALSRKQFQEVWPRRSDEEEGEDDEVLLTSWEKKDRCCLVIVDTSGIHQLRISWCQCSTAEEPHIQLVRNHLFPASIKRPSTTFTFSLLDYFHIDSVE